MSYSVIIQNIDVELLNRGGRSSVGRAPDCDSGRRGFEPHRPPHFLLNIYVCELIEIEIREKYNR